MDNTPDKYMHASHIRESDDVFRSLDITYSPHTQDSRIQMRRVELRDGVGSQRYLTLGRGNEISIRVKARTVKETQRGESSEFGKDYTSGITIDKSLADAMRAMAERCKSIEARDGHRELNDSTADALSALIDEAFRKIPLSEPRTGIVLCADEKGQAPGARR